MTAYYNEIDPYAAQWLRNLITAGHIAPGVVDERSIEDVTPADLDGFTQCHFFAGVGVWSLALRRAGWPDDRPVWTGSCPCQPFSAAGKGTGFNDERHLWPSFQWLIQQCRPSVVFGEQVASKAVEPWIDLVQTDVEAMGYAFGCVPFPSAGVGAPHIRDRAFWVGYAIGSGRQSQQAVIREHGHGMEQAGREQVGSVEAGGDASGGLADTESDGNDGTLRDHQREEVPEAVGRSLDLSEPRPTGPTNGNWGAADWLLCRDGKWRPVEPGTFPLANGATSRVGRLRAYGNAINAEAAKEFIAAFLDCAN